MKRDRDPEVKLCILQKLKTVQLRAERNKVEHKRKSLGTDIKFEISLRLFTDKFPLEADIVVKSQSHTALIKPQVNGFSLAFS